MWEAGAVPAILRTKYFLWVNTVLVRNHLNFPCVRQQRFRNPLPCAGVCANTRLLRNVELRPPAAITGQKEGGTREINSICVLAWSEEWWDTTLKAGCR